MVEILTSPGFEYVLKTLHVAGKRTYSYIANEKSYWINSFEVWEVPNLFIAATSSISNNAWTAMFPNEWWRSCSGTNLEDGNYKVVKFNINGKDILCWENPEKIEDFVFDDEEVSEADRDHNYGNILQYCSEEWGIGQSTNICAVCVGLAKLNKTTLGQLFLDYMN